MKNKLECPSCEALDTLVPTLFADDFKHGAGQIHVEGLEGFVCSACGADPVFADQARRNHCRVNDSRRIADGMLSSDEVRSIRKSLGLTQGEAGELIGGGPMAFSKYERGEVIQSAVMDRFLRVLAIYPFIVDTLRAGSSPRSFEYETVKSVAYSLVRRPALRICAANESVMADYPKYAAQ